jgi:hypothetical protein
MSDLGVWTWGLGSDRYLSYRPSTGIGALQVQLAGCSVDRRIQRQDAMNTREAITAAGNGLVLRIVPRSAVSLNISCYTPSAPAYQRSRRIFLMSIFTCVWELYGKTLGKSSKCEISPRYSVYLRHTFIDCLGKMMAEPGFPLYNVIEFNKIHHAVASLKQILSMSLLSTRAIDQRDKANALAKLSTTGTVLPIWRLNGQKRFSEGERRNRCCWPDNCHCRLCRASAPQLGRGTD